MTYKARGRESQESRHEKERIYAIKRQLNYQIILFEAGCDVFGIRNGIRVATEVERRASPQIERNIRRDFAMGIDLLIIACRSARLQRWVEVEVIPRVSHFRPQIRLTTFAQLRDGNIDVFRVTPEPPNSIQVFTIERKNHE